MRLHLILTIIVLCIATALTAQKDWNILKTGAGGWVTGMHIHPSGHPIFARVDVGSAYRWSAESQSWINIVSSKNLPDADVDWDKYSGVLSIVSAPSKASVAYMAYYNGIYRSDEYGETWQKTNSPTIEMRANDDDSKLAGERLSVDPANEYVVYFGSIEDGLWKTVDGGKSWTKITAVPDGAAGRGIRQILFDPTSERSNGQTQRIYAFVDEEGVYKSEDGGSSWSLTSFGINTPWFYDAEIDRSGAVYIVGEDDTATSFGCYRFDGSSWTQIYDDLTYTIGELAVDPFDNNRIFLFSNGFSEIYRTNNGQSSNPNWVSLALTKEANGIPWLAWSDTNWFSLGEIVFDPKTPDRLWIADGVGVWRSDDLDDSNMTWEEMSVGQEHLVSNDVVALPNAKAVTTHWDRPVFRHDSLDAYPVEHQPSQRFNSAWRMGQSATDPNYLVAIIEDHRFCCYDGDTRSSGYSTDGGATWTKFPNMPDPGNTNMKFGNIAVAAADKDNIVWLPSNGEMPYYTTDRGTTWTQVTLPGSTVDCCLSAFYFQRIALAADQVQDNTFYIYDWGDGSIFKSTNGGQSWIKQTNSTLTSFAYNGKLLAVPDNAGHLLFANGPEQATNLIEGLYQSTDGGQNWSLLSNTDKVLNVAVGKAKSDGYPAIYIYGIVSGKEGYFISDDQGATWTSIGIHPFGIYDWPKVMTGDKFRYGRLYVGFGGNGFVYYESEESGCTDTDGNGICDISPYIHVDQFGYLPNSKKVAVISDPQQGYNANESFTPSATLEVRRAGTDASAFVAAPVAWNSGAIHSQSGDKGWWFDFSTVTTSGEYYIYDLTNDVRSATFKIGDDVFDAVLQASAKMYFYNRCGGEKVMPFADANWVDGVSFNNPLQDANCRYVYDRDNVQLEKDLTGGWFDAGDYNKYVTFAHSAIHNLLWAYEENPASFGDDWNIPESDNCIPDILDEVKWELDWLMKMTNADGTVHIKMGSIEYSDNAAAPPSANTDPRYYGPTCSSASIAVASMFAHAAKVFEAFPDLAAYAAQLEAQAIDCWDYALPLLNANTLEENCDDGTIKSGDADWSAATQKENAVAAAVHLFDLTATIAYSDYAAAHLNDVESIVNSFWGPYNLTVNDALLLYTTLSNTNAAAVSTITNSITTAVSNNWNGFFGFNADDLYRAQMPDWSYHWGSNSPKAAYGVLNQQLIRYGINSGSAADFALKATEQVHYFHGVNPQGLVYLSNMYAYGGDRCANEIYHTWFADGSDWDHAINSLYGPAPGFVTGGPNSSFTIGSLSPPAGQPEQKSYLDFNDGFPNNSWEITEPAIYYQAIYLRLLAAYSSMMAYVPECGPSSTPPLGNLNSLKGKDGFANIQLFPNPNEGHFTITIDLPKAQSSLLMINDITGRQLQQRKVNLSAGSQRLTFDLSDYPSGVYWMHLKMEEHQILRKVVIGK